MSFKMMGLYLKTIKKIKQIKVKLKNVMTMQKWLKRDRHLIIGISLIKLFWLTKLFSMSRKISKTNILWAIR